MSIENPTDVDEYLEKILDDSGMELDKELREEMVKELDDRFEVVVVSPPRPGVSPASGRLAGRRKLNRCP